MGKQSQKLGPEFLNKCLPYFPPVLGREEAAHPPTERDGSNEQTEGPSVVKMSCQCLKAISRKGPWVFRGFC